MCSQVSKSPGAPSNKDNEVDTITLQHSTSPQHNNKQYTPDEIEKLKKLRKLKFMNRKVSRVPDTL